MAVVDMDQVVGLDMTLRQALRALRDAYPEHDFRAVRTAESVRIGYRTRGTWSPCLLAGWYHAVRQDRGLVDGVVGEIDGLKEKVDAVMDRLLVPEDRAGRAWYRLAAAVRQLDEAARILEEDM